MQTDFELVRQAAQGDRSAFHVLVDRHARDLFRLARSLSKTRSDAEDIVQETFIGAFRGLAGFNEKASVRTWLSRILMRRAAKAWHRSRHSRGAVPLEIAQDTGATAATAGTGRLSVPSGTTGVDQRLDLNQILELLGPEHRQVLVLRELQGLSYVEIAQTLGIPRGTVESRLHRARNELRERLNGYLD